MIAAGRDRLRNRGFSLAEMLVALAVLALAMVLLAAMVGRIGYGLAVWGHNDTRLERIAAAQFTLRQRLGNAAPERDTQAGGAVVDFRGGTDTMDFIAPAPDRDSPDALRHYRLMRDGAGNLVLFSVSTLDPRVDMRGVSVVGWKAEPLLTGIARLDIRYWGRNPDAVIRGLPPLPAWQGYWSHRNALPQMVRISVGFADDSTQVWPDLVIRPHGAIAEPCSEDAPCGAGGGAA